jgi:serine protease Do
MAFPVDLAANIVDARGLFVVQDPDIRSRVLPLFSFDPTAPDARPKGHGTAFRIDPWSCCATAFHVLEDLFEVNNAGSEIILKPSVRLAALDFGGLGYGLVPIPDGGWRPLAGSFSFFGIERRPLSSARLRNVTEIMAIQIRLPTPSQTGTPCLPVDFRRWRPRVGETILALGYADLDAPSLDHADANRPISQYLYGSLGNIMQIESADGARGRPWPMIRIDANWPGAMSGGPVFNEAGHVVGLVSTGFKGEGGGSATFFSGWNVPERIFRSLDPANPGWYYCWGAFDCTGTLIRYGQDKTEIERFGQDHGLVKSALVSIDPATANYVMKC